MGYNVFMPWKPFKHICETCNKIFLVPRQQRFCSYRCSSLSPERKKVNMQNLLKVNDNPKLKAKAIKAARKSIKGEKHWNWKGGISIGKNKRDYKNSLEAKRRTSKQENGGSFSVEDWIKLKQYCGNRCVCCHKSEPEIKLTRDHKIPISLGGSSNIDNIQPLCKSCNSIKRQKVIHFIGMRRKDYEEYIKSKNIKTAF